MTPAANPGAEQARPDRSKMHFFGLADAPELIDTDMMEPVVIPDGIIGAVDLGAGPSGTRVRILLRQAGDDGFSLVSAWYGPGFRLPRHSHSVDCTYYVTKGQIRLGNRCIGEGAGFFIPAGHPYAFRVDEDGPAELLEFRHGTQFDIRYLDDLDALRAIAASAAEREPVWAQVRPA